MSEIITIILIGVALSMDTFSISLSLGIFNITKKKSLIFSLIVGFFHFSLPLIAQTSSALFFKKYDIDGSKAMGLILLFLAFQMIMEMKRKTNTAINISYKGLVLIALSVSLDSFMTGIGLATITSNKLLAALVFSISSFCFTNLGIIVGKYFNQKLGDYAKYFGFSLMIIIGVKYLLF